MRSSLKLCLQKKKLSVTFQDDTWSSSPLGTNDKTQNTHNCDNTMIHKYMANWSYDCKMISSFERICNIMSSATALEDQDNVVMAPSVLPIYCTRWHSCTILVQNTQFRVCSSRLLPLKFTNYTEETQNDAFAIDEQNYSDWYQRTFHGATIRSNVLPVKRAFQGYPKCGRQCEQHINRILSLSELTFKYTTYDKAIYQATFQDNILLCFDNSTTFQSCANMTRRQRHSTYWIICLSRPYQWLLWCWHHSNQ